MEPSAMSSLPLAKPGATARSRWLDGLSDPAHSIGSPGFDALCFWGSPLLAFAGIAIAERLALSLPGTSSEEMAKVVVLISAVLTYAHLMAVAPRAYLNREVFNAYRFRLTVVPVLLLLALVVSPTLLIAGGVLTTFWDIHHSAMQNFGIGRIYDMKAGNGSETLRTTDLGLHWFLYVGPLVAGASLMTHVNSFADFNGTTLTELALLPGVLESGQGAFKAIGIAAWTATLALALYRYRKAAAAGYRMPVHKAVLILTTGLVSLLAWGFSSVLVALASINIYHAVQYFALVWLKEGRRMRDAVGAWKRWALPLFLLACGFLGVAYEIVVKAKMGALLAPFIACSLLHFWFDSFVWSVRKKQV